MKENISESRVSVEPDNLAGKGFTIKGTKRGGSLGRSVSDAGDINGDGFGEVIVSAPFADDSSGESYVIFGKSSGFTTNITPNQLNGRNGFIINGATEFESSGFSVSKAGDVNGDRLTDLVIGTLGGNRSYIVFGKRGAFASSINLSSLNGSNGFVIEGTGEYGNLGFSVSDAGDINGDDIDDVVVSSPFANSTGQSYVIFGKTDGFGSSINVSSLNGNNGFTINGIDAYDQLGFSVSNAGDVNGDDITDLVVGAPYATRSDRGESYVIFGKTGGFDSSINVSSLNGNNGFIIEGRNNYDNLGYSVSSAGDVNGDDITDLVVSATDAGGSYSGEAYVIFGKTGGFNRRINVSSLNGRNGFTIVNSSNAYGELGVSVSNIGDVNGDDIADLVVGDFRDNNNTGKAYVIYGKNGNFSPKLDVNLIDGRNGFVITGSDSYDLLGISVSGAGDVNGDDLSDLVVGATGAGAKNTYGFSNYFGEAYVIFGDTPNVINGNNTNNLLEGTAEDDEINGNAGNDTLVGLGDSDLLNGGSGNDNLSGGNGGDLLDGGAGVDSLNGGSGNDIYLVDNTRDSIIEVSPAATEIDKVQSSVNFSLSANLENLILLGVASNATGNSSDNSITGNNTANIITGGAGDDSLNGVGGNDNLSGEAGDDRLTGEAGNDTLLGGEGVDNLFGNEGNDSLLGGGGDDSRLSSFIFENGRRIAPLILLANIVGGAGNDTLNGNAGIDGLDGGAGNDSLSGGTEGDRLLGSGGNDTLNGDSGEDSLEGGTGGDLLNGGNGNDFMTGETGNDTLTGGDGNDTVDGFDGNDLINGNAGNDELIGTSGNDTLTGGEGSDTLDSGIGNDSLVGGSGNDTYRVDSQLDRINETVTNASEIDSVESSVTYTLGTNLDNLILIGTGNINGIGNNLNNSLTGNNSPNSLNGNDGNDTINGDRGNDTLIGGAGNDLLTGGAGGDRLTYATGMAFSPSDVGVDLVSDFGEGADKIVLSKRTFTAISSRVGTGFSARTEFELVNTDALADRSSAIIVYNTVNGNLFYNQNGSAPGFGSGAQFAVLNGTPGVTANDFVIIA